MAEESLPTASLSGKPADIESIRLSLAKIELVALQATFTTCAGAMSDILAMDQPMDAIPILDFLATHPFQERLDHAQDLLGAVVPNPCATEVEA
ncbi:MAG: hypothetical protein EOL86_09490 [Deltaproteobacteria bacterium]|nr:hypothetical protein [Clostridia bacterium]NCD25806.1 hypothetical protein [Deltaproteobacteria bacterium]